MNILVTGHLGFIGSALFAHLKATTDHNNGHFAVEFANYAGDTGKVHAFEPQRIIFQQLCGNIFINGLNNVYCHNMAVGDTSGKVRIQCPDYFDKHDVNFGDVSITEDYYSSEEVQLVRLDDFKFDNVSIIKIDVQGFEPKVITGAINTINTHRPFIFIEIESPQLKKFNYTESELITQIESLDYIVTQFQIGIKYQTDTGNCLDYVCIPKEKYEIQNFIIT